MVFKRFLITNQRSVKKDKDMIKSIKLCLVIALFFVLNAHVVIAQERVETIRTFTMPSETVAKPGELTTESVQPIQPMGNLRTVKQYEESYYVDLSNNILEKKELPELLSNIEKLFNGEILQFGYDIFGENIGATVAGVSSKTHVLSSGDRVKVLFWGDTLDLMKITGSGASALESVVNATVDADGNIFIPGVGLIYAKGRTVPDLEREININLAEKYEQLNAKIAVESPSSFNIMVVGKVKNPGSVGISPHENFIDALKSAGGILKTGSLRNIEHIDAHTKKKTSIDLYQFLLEGHYPKIKLKNGDVLLVKPIGKVIGLNEGVKNPAIYEFLDNETLDAAINYAGGFLPSITPDNIEIERFDIPSGQKSIVSITESQLKSFKPKDGDMLSFVKLYERPENNVSIEGNVKRPRTVEYKPDMRLSDILKSRDDLLYNTYTEQAVITRIDGLNKGILPIPVSLSAFFAGKIDPVLKPQDVIRVYAATKMGVVEVAGEITNPSFIPYKDKMTLKDILSIVDFKTNPNILVAEVSGSEDKSKSAYRKNLSVDTKVVYLYELLTKNNPELDVPLKPNDKIIFRPVSEKEPLEEVAVYGYVKKPGIYKVIHGMKLIDVINIAGGLRSDAYLPGMVFLRSLVEKAQRKAYERSETNLQLDIAEKVTEMHSIKDSSRRSDLKSYIDQQEDLLQIMQKKAKEEFGRIVLNINSNNLAEIPPEYNLEIKDGDQIIIPYKPQHVVVMGEVSNQSAIAFLPGQTPEYYIDQVGGFTKDARKKSAYLIRASGRTEAIKSFNTLAVNPGDSIIIPRKVGIPINWGNVLKSTLGMAFQTTGMVYMLMKIAD
jgi:protein involved in polysaccharide export with SLBB domain